MKKILTHLLILVFISKQTIAQTNTFPSSGSVGIGTTTPDASSLLEIKSISKGLLIPRMTKDQRDAIVKPVTGLMIYQTNSSPGFYYYDGGKWTTVSAQGANKTLSNLSATSINADLLPDTSGVRSFGSIQKKWKNIYFNGSVFFGNIKAMTFIGLTNTAISPGSSASLTTGNYNTAVGNFALNKDTSGSNNTAIGFSALYKNQNTYSNNGSDNTATGSYALFSNTTGDNNTANGSHTLYYNTNGYFNAANGSHALYSNTAGFANTANGFDALYSNTSGGNNTANGFEALYFNTSGGNNTANGSLALHNNTTGGFNIAEGYDVLSDNTIGNSNIAIGFQALAFNTSGSENIAIGENALYHNITGTENIAVGRAALFYGSGSHNTVIGEQAGPGVNTDTVTNGTAIGYSAYLGASNRAVIGNSEVTVIGGQVGWSKFSDGRFKNNIKQNVPGLTFINKLNPVTYTVELKKFDRFTGKTDSLINSNSVQYAIDEKKIRTGFIAQEVEETAKEIGYDFDGVNAPQNNKDNYSLVYADFVPSLVKAVQELSTVNDIKNKKIDSLEQSNQSLNDKLNALSDRIKQIENLVNQPGSNISSNISKPTAALLYQNIPNPFKSGSSIRYYIPEGFRTAQLIITNAAGITLKTYTIKAAGFGMQAINNNDLSGGVYQYSLLINGKVVHTKKMISAK